MLKLHLISFQLLFFLYALLSKNFVLTEDVSTFEINYKENLQKANIQQPYIDLLGDDNVCYLVQKKINFELLREIIYDERLNSDYRVNVIYNELATNYSSLRDADFDTKTKIGTFIESLIQNEENSIESFFNTFCEKSINIRKKVREYEDLLYQESVDVANKQKNIESIITGIKQIGGKDLEEIGSRIAAIDELKKDLISKIDVLYELNINVKSFQNDLKNYIHNYKSERHGLKDISLLEDLESVMFKVIHSIRRRGFNLKTKLEVLFKRANALINILSGRDIETKTIEQKNIESDLAQFGISEIVEDEYQQFIRKSSNNETTTYYGNNYLDFRNTLIVIEDRANKALNLKLSNISKEDYIYNLEKALEDVKKIDEKLAKEYAYLIKAFDYLYEVLNMVMYGDSYSVHTYNYAWVSLANYQGADFIYGINRLIEAIRVLKDRAIFFKSNSIYFSGDYLLVNKIDLIIKDLNNALLKMEKYSVNMRKLVNGLELINVTRKELEQDTFLFRKKLISLRNHLNFYVTVTDRISTEIDNIIGIITTILNQDVLTKEFKKIRKLWKSYINSKKKEYKVNNKLINEFKKDKNIIFPPALGLTDKSEENSSVNKNVISSSLFAYLYKEVLKKYDGLNTQEKMMKQFLKEYRSVDIILKIIKTNRKNLRSEYNKKRNEIIELLKVKNYTKKIRDRFYDELINLEKKILSFTHNFFYGRINLDIKVKDSVELVKSDYYKDVKRPHYYILIEDYITKRFLTMNKWRKFINKNSKIIPPALIYKIENV